MYLKRGLTIRVRRLCAHCGLLCIRVGSRSTNTSACNVMVLLEPPFGFRDTKLSESEQVETSVLLDLL